MTTVTALKKRQIQEFSDEHIPYRIHFVEMGIFACLLIGRGEAAKPGPLSVAGWTFQDRGKTIFLNMAVESALMYCRVLLNFLGVVLPPEPDLLSQRGGNLIVELDPKISPRMREQFAHHTLSSDVFADHGPLLFDLAEN